jgi:predicted nuclease of predicted toxin-antitoxin system
MTATELKFMVDVGVGKKVEQWLREAGCDVLAVREINPHAGDKEILKLAEEDSRIVLTMDKDFGELVYLLGKAHTGVLVLRMEDANGDVKMNVVKNILQQHADKLAGNFCAYKDGTLRISRKPISP